ncbi:sulfite exporter TauE/SafE family protein [Sphingosinicella sp. BN140058]|uniref:sulfite exporter TauE/SafE family protein n=1 Tax=Sphingosinicella sp. BN140058 TaxID=1892855 RepID=UPI001010D0DE|nr:sulfite exporter TauE/SafE family protein [Sphingosinicella sp. BN140058]QAY79438.1 sulfite exporter TauE/SafE family protein [Sphingosinicella sp. BN140058]
MDSIVWIALLMAIAAALYSTVGHGGASAYLAIMALFAVAPEVMRPTALALNLVVAGFAVLRFAVARQINVRLAAIFAATAAPAAFVGGMISIPPEYYRPLVGIFLCLAALRLFWQPRALADRPVQPPSLLVAAPAGATLGLLAGLTGTGGGIFLSPLIILFGWEEPRKTSGVAATFILINSMAGLAGNFASVQRLPAALPWLVAAVAVGALLGTWLGVDRLPRARLLQCLGLVLVIAGGKLLLS